MVHGSSMNESQQSDPDELACEPEWMTVSEAADYGQMSTQRIYNACDDGLPFRQNPLSNVREIEKSALEHWFCPFKQSINYYKATADIRQQEQRIRLEQSQKECDLLSEHLSDLRKVIKRLEKDLDAGQKRESALLEIIAKNDT